MLRSKCKKVKNGLKLNAMFTIFVQFLVENRICQITSLSTEKSLKSKGSADQILTMKSDFVSFDHMQVAIRSFSNNWQIFEPSN